MAKCFYYIKCSLIFIINIGKTQNWALNVSKNQQIVYSSIKKISEQSQNTDIKIL
jgi:hypothetical protein